MGKKKAKTPDVVQWGKGWTEEQALVVVVTLANGEEVRMGFWARPIDGVYVEGPADARATMTVCSTAEEWERKLHNRPA